MRNERGKHQSVPFRYDWKCLYYRGYRRCGGIIQPGTLCVGRSGHRKESDEAYRRTYKCKSEKYDAGSCFKSYRISKGNYILTDDQAPVELLGMQVIDELIKDEVQYYKDIYKERGIKGLMESL